MYREYKNPKIYRNFKIAKVLSLISLVLAVVISVVISCEFIIENYLIKKIAFEFYHIYFIALYYHICFIALLICTPIKLYSFTSKVFKFRGKPFMAAETKRSNDITNLKTIILYSFSDIILVVFLFLISLPSGNFSYVGLAAYLLGYSLLSHIFSYISAFILIKPLRLMEKEWKESPPDFYIEEQQKKLKKNNYQTKIIAIICLKSAENNFL